MIDRVRIVGHGRAGGSFAAALRRVGLEVDVLGQPGERPTESALAQAAHGVDMVLLSVPDAVVAEVAQQVEAGDALVAHAAGSLGLEALDPHVRRASLHPLVSLPSAEIGAERLLAGASFAVDVDPENLADLDVVKALVARLGGRAFTVEPSRRVAYHAAACIASNHLVALLGQVERVAASAGLPLDAFMDLVRGTLDNVAELGPAAALTGPAARGDEATIAAHLAAIDPDDRDAYSAMADLCRRLAADGRG